jgi:hypothetical protein
LQVCSSSSIVAHIHAKPLSSRLDCSPSSIRPIRDKTPPNPLIHPSQNQEPQFFCSSDELVVYIGKEKIWSRGAVKKKVSCSDIVRERDLAGINSRYFRESIIGAVPWICLPHQPIIPNLYPPLSYAAAVLE